jgi:hypothetical protein
MARTQTRPQPVASFDFEDQRYESTKGKGLPYAQILNPSVAVFFVLVQSYRQAQ